MPWCIDSCHLVTGILPEPELASIGWDGQAWEGPWTRLGSAMDAVISRLRDPVRHPAEVHSSFRLYERAESKSLSYWFSPSDVQWLSGPEPISSSITQFSCDHGLGPQMLWEGRTSDGWRIGDAEGVLELVWLLLTTVLAWVRGVVELI